MPSQIAKIMEDMSQIHEKVTLRYEVIFFNPFHTKPIFLEFAHRMLSWFQWNQFNIWTNSRKIYY